MKRNRLLAAGFALSMAATSVAYAQTKTVEGDAETVTATVEAIDAVTRTLTVKDAKGNFEPITVPRSMTRFNEIKVGDTISARYYNNVVFRVKPAGEPAVDSTGDGVTRGAGTSPAATAASQRTITAVITAIDPSVPSISFKGEKVNWTYSSRVKDRDALSKVKVGDRIDVTWTEALTVAIVPKK
jgi:hypothetical protein